MEKNCFSENKIFWRYEQKPSFTSQRWINGNKNVTWIEDFCNYYQKTAKGFQLVGSRIKIRLFGEQSTRRVSLVVVAVSIIKSNYRGGTGFRTKGWIRSFHCFAKSEFTRPQECRKGRHRKWVASRRVVRDSARMQTDCQTTNVYTPPLKNVRTLARSW